VRLPATFAPLQHRNYRLYFTGQLFSLIGSWMEQTGRGWLVTLLAARAVAGPEAERLANGYLGWITVIGSLPMLFGAFLGGLAADRFPKRRLIAYAQSAQMVLSLAMAALVFLGHASIWYVLAFSLLVGITSVIDVPARQAFVSELVGKETLAGAIGLKAYFSNAISVKRQSPQTNLVPLRRTMRRRKVRPNGMACLPERHSKKSIRSYRPLDKRVRGAIECALFAEVYS